jgi:hypothetical protein
MYDWIYRGLAFGSILAGLFAVIALIAAVLAYVLSSIGLYRAAQKRSIPNPWMAWVPLTREYLVGTMLKNELIVTPKLRIPYFQFILPASTVLTWIASAGFFNWLFMLVSIVLAVLGFISLFRQYRESNAVLYGILAGIPLLSVVGCFFIYQLGMKDAPDPAANTTAFPG